MSVLFSPLYAFFVPLVHWLVDQNWLLIRATKIVRNQKSGFTNQIILLTTTIAFEPWISINNSIYSSIGSSMLIYWQFAGDFELEKRVILQTNQMPQDWNIGVFNLKKTRKNFSIGTVWKKYEKSMRKVCAEAQWNEVPIYLCTFMYLLYLDCTSCR